MTTESRMREALEKLVAWVDAMNLHEIAPVDAAREALSPPARRTSYEWEFPGDSTKYSVRWGSDNQWSIWAMNWRSQGKFEECGFGEFAAAIATLAGLTKPEGDEHG